MLRRNTIVLAHASGFIPGGTASGPKRAYRDPNEVKTELPFQKHWVMRWDWYDWMWRSAPIRGALDSTRSARPRANMIWPFVGGSFHQRVIRPVFTKTGGALEQFGRNWLQAHDCLPIYASSRRAVEWDGTFPYVDKAKAFVAPSAMLIGDCRVGPAASIWYSALLRADGCPIIVQTGSMLLDRVLITTKNRQFNKRGAVTPKYIEKYDTQGTKKYLSDASQAWLNGGSFNEAYIGVEALVEGGCSLTGPCIVEQEASIGARSVISEGCIIGRGAVVEAGSYVPPGVVVPPYTHYQGCLHDIFNEPGEAIHEETTCVVDPLFDDVEELEAVANHEKDICDNDIVSAHRAHMQFATQHLEEHCRNEGMTIERQLDELCTLGWCVNGLSYELLPAQTANTNPSIPYAIWQWAGPHQSFTHNAEERS